MASFGSLDEAFLNPLKTLGFPAAKNRLKTWKINVFRLFFQRPPCYKKPWLKPSRKMAENGGFYGPLIRFSFPIFTGEFLI